MLVLDLGFMLMSGLGLELEFRLGLVLELESVPKKELDFVSCFSSHRRRKEL